MIKLGRALYQVLIRLLTIAVLVIAFISIRQVIVSRSAGLTAATSQKSTSVPQTANPQAAVVMPDFHRPAGKYSRGIPRLALLNTLIPGRPSVEVTTYTVQPGDNLFAISELYGLHPETILWGNYDVLRDNPQLLSPGQELNILPEDGVYYQWEEGDNLQDVASFFKVEPDAIINYAGNKIFTDLTKPMSTEIAVGTWLVIPGGKRELKDWGPPAITRKNPAAAAYYGEGYCGQVYEGAIGTGWFIWPTVATHLSGYDYRPGLHPGIDIAGAEGNAVFATDSGVIVFSGWSQFGYGYLIVIDHGNGWQSAYGHLSSMSVGCGQSVGQGSVIGGIGTTGNSTGPHLHFELRSDVYGKVNPWDFVSP
jgi:murein DD-endopeptidase MepM/ murein hydrolase activator NlpD